MAPATVNWKEVEELVKTTMKPDKAVEVCASIPIANIYGPKIIPPPIPRAPAAIPVI